MQPSTTETTVSEVEYALPRIKTPKGIWDRMKIQAIHEGVTAEQLSARIFEAYLRSPEAERRRQ